MEKLDTDLICLKQKHSDGYDEEIQMYMGLSGVSYADFVYYTFKGLIIVRVKFDKEHFQKLIVKLNSFYKDYVVTQVQKKKKRNTFFHWKCFMLSNKKQSRKISFTLFTILKTIQFFLSTDWFSCKFQVILEKLGEKISSQSKSS